MRNERGLGLTAEEYQFYYRSKNARLAEQLDLVSDVYVDPDKVRLATLKAWGMLKRNCDLTGQQSPRDGLKHAF